MKILVDMLTPKQVLFLGELSERLEDAGHRVIRVSRDFPETLQLLRMKRIKARIIGAHRRTLEGKLQESLRRTARLARLMRNLGVDMVVAYPSVEAARSAFGLSVPYYCASDSPHAEAVSRLTIPLAAKLFSPAVIPKEDWIRYGIAPSNIVQYNALDPYVWVRKAKPEPKMIQKLGLELNSRVVTLRLEESFASYLMKTSGDWRNLAVEIVRELLRKGCQTRIVVLPRYGPQYEAFRGLRRKVIIPRVPVLGSALLASTSVFIGGGGTMTAEAALMGVPTISYFPAGPTRVELYLQERGLLTRLTDPKSIAEQTVSWLHDETYQADNRTRAQELVRSMEDPLRVIVDNINP